MSTLTVILGKRGSGKSTFLAKEIRKQQKKGNKCFTNVYYKGCYKVEPKKLNLYDFPEGAFIVIDEAGFEFNSRSWSSFGNDLFRFFTMSRHYKLSGVYLAVQSFARLDTSIRELADNLILCQPSLFNFAFIRYKHIFVDMGITTEGDLKEWYEFKPFPRYALRLGLMNYFDSYYREPKFLTEFEIWKSEQ